MKKYFLQLSIIGLMAAIFTTACASAPTPAQAPTLDLVATVVFQQVYIRLTQTALAAPLIPTSTVTPPPTPAETPTPEPTSNVPLKRPVVTAFAGCWAGPGPSYTLISNIAAKKYVEFLGVGNTPGWYIIRNPYFRNPCWIEAIYLKLDPRLDTSQFPIMTPTAP